MIHRLTIAVATVFFGLGSASVASASPSADESGEPSCTYSLSLPQVVEVSGTAMVTATLAFTSCTGRILPNDRVACVSMEGYDSAGQCAQKLGSDPAQVFYAPYQPGATYISRGTACATLTGPGNAVCATLGPYTKTL
jgi:hypothetical protein